MPRRTPSRRAKDKAKAKAIRERNATISYTSTSARKAAKAADLRRRSGSARKSPPGLDPKTLKLATQAYNRRFPARRSRRIAAKVKATMLQQQAMVDELKKARAEAPALVDTSTPPTTPTSTRVKVEKSTMEVGNNLMDMKVHTNLLSSFEDHPVMHTVKPLDLEYQGGALGTPQTKNGHATYPIMNMLNEDGVVPMSLDNDGTFPPAAPLPEHRSRLTERSALMTFAATQREPASGRSTLRSTSSVTVMTASSPRVAT